METNCLDKVPTVVYVRYISSETTASPPFCFFLNTGVQFVYFGAQPFVEVAVPIHIRRTNAATAGFFWAPDLFPIFKAIWTTPASTNHVPMILAQAIPMGLIIILPATSWATDFSVNVFHAISKFVTPSCSSLSPAINLVC